jgi:uncharacterized protein YegL
MKTHIPNVVSGLNNFLYNLKQRPDTIYMSVVSFNDRHDYIVRYENVKNIVSFHESIFKCNGITALYDTICLTMLDVLYNFKNLKSHLFIITDGEDNASKTYTKDDTDQICNESIKSGLWGIIHCHTDVSILNIPNVVYDVNDISNIFNNLVI